MRPALRSPRPPFRAADATDSVSPAGRSELAASNCLEELALEEDSWLDRRLPNDLKIVRKTLQVEKKGDNFFKEFSKLFL
jgi:hypothetical protein